MEFYIEPEPDGLFFKEKEMKIEAVTHMIKAMDGDQSNQAMSPEKYLELTARTCKQFPIGMALPELHTDLLHAILGISGEAGELVDGFKKSLIYGKVIDFENLKEEAGDILWYMALLLRTINTSFEEVMAQNIAKLQKRYPERYTDADAIARADKKDGE